jgi:hypothetical protein
MTTIPAEVTAKARKLNSDEAMVYTIHPRSQASGQVYTLDGDGEWQSTPLQAAGFSETALSMWLDSQAGVEGAYAKLIRV